MNADLEETLDGLGPGYRALVENLRAPFSPGASRAPRTAGLVPVAFLVAASLFVVLGLAILFQPRPSFRSASGACAVYTVAYAPTEEALEIILASQRPDGSWDNDFITRQNAAALRRSGDARVQLAYRRAVRYLRFKGLVPLTDDELRARGESAAKTVGRT